MKSMTGHGRGEVVAKGARVVVESFSVNRKQGEVSLAAGREYAWMEPAVRDEVLKRLSRGKVQVSVAIERTGAPAEGLIDHERASVFLQEARRLQKKLGIDGGITLEAVLAAPGVLKAANDDGRDFWPLVKRALSKSLDAMLEMREREGAHLKKELTGSMKRLTALIRQVRALAPRVPARQR